MKAVRYAFLILVGVSVLTAQQAGPGGTWKADDLEDWSVYLRTDGSRLTGLVSHCATVFQQPVEIYDANISGNTVTFKCMSPDHDRVLTFTGSLKGDAISIAWEKRVRDGGLDNGSVDRRFSPSAARQFIVRRIADGELANAANETRGVEFAAGVNVRAKDEKAEGLLFVPRNVSHARAVIVVIKYGLGFDNIFYDPRWRKLAASADAPLLWVRFSEIGLSADEFPIERPVIQGADALVSLLQEIAQKSGHPELADAPVILWGHSGAGGRASLWASQNPQRTLAFVRYHSGPVTGDVNVVAKIPALYLSGRQDTTAPPRAAEDLWKSGRSLNAPWTFAIEPEAQHGDPKDLEKANDLVIPWIAAVTRQRLSPSGSLRSVADGAAWIGNNQTAEIRLFGEFTGPKAEASWLPDETTARAWQRMLGGGTRTK